jgi:hypothetical protein
MFIRMTNLWCGSVTKDEGSSSPQAIAFILGKYNPSINRLTKQYSKEQIPSKRKRILQTKKRVVNSPNLKFKNSDKIWIN